MTDPTFTIEDITPAIAGQMLTNNMTNNRSLRRGIIAQYARDMAAGAWRLTGDPIRFTEAGGLIDGQHRLHAVIEADVNVTMTVARGIPAAAVVAIDAGARRHLADYLSFDGIEDPRLVAAAVAETSAWERYFAGLVRSGGGRFVANRSQRHPFVTYHGSESHTERLEVLGRRPELTKSVAVVKAMCTGRNADRIVMLPIGVSTMIHMIMGDAGYDYLHSIAYADPGASEGARHALKRLTAAQSGYRQNRLSTDERRIILARGITAKPGMSHSKATPTAGNLIIPGDEEWYFRAPPAGDA